MKYIEIENAISAALTAVDALLNLAENLEQVGGGDAINRSIDARGAARIAQGWVVALREMAKQ